MREVLVMGMRGICSDEPIKAGFGEYSLLTLIDGICSIEDSSRTHLDSCCCSFFQSTALR